MIITVLFIKVDIDLHKEVKAESAICEKPVYKLYNRAMKEFSEKMKRRHLPIYFMHKSTNEYKDIRVEKVDKDIYRIFKITCIQKDISISQGINLALASWLECIRDDSSNLELRT